MKKDDKKYKIEEIFKKFEFHHYLKNTSLEDDEIILTPIVDRDVLQFVKNENGEDNPFKLQISGILKKVDDISGIVTYSVEKKQLIRFLVNLYYDELRSNNKTEFKLTSDEIKDVVFLSKLFKKSRERDFLVFFRNLCKEGGIYIAKSFWTKFILSILPTTPFSAGRWRNAYKFNEHLIGGSIFLLQLLLYLELMMKGKSTILKFTEKIPYFNQFDDTTNLLFILLLLFLNIFFSISYEMIPGLRKKITNIIKNLLIIVIIFFIVIFLLKISF